MLAEKHFGVSVPEDRAEKTITVEQFAHLLCELQSGRASALNYEQVLLELRQLIAREFKIHIERIVPSARFVQDLGLDQ